MGKSNSQKNSKKQMRQSEIDQAKRSRRLMGWTLVVLVLAAAGILLLVNNYIGKPGTQRVDIEAFQYDKQPALGAKDAPIKIVEFADFKCPSCKEFDQTVLPQLKKEFIDKGDVQLFFMNYPIISPNGDSRTAAIAGEAVYHQSPAEFWKFYEAVYAAQGDENANWATPSFLVQVARQAGVKVDYAKLEKEINNQTYAQDVKADEAIGDKHGVNGTPTLFINGKMASDDETFNYSSLKNELLRIKGGKS